jgi:hypothetical protein
MSAPSTAYFPINFKFRGSNNVEMTVNPAKAQADLATLKARFYLDDVICFQANVGGVLYHGFWGVVLPSGFNYNHHKTTRLLEINGPKPGQLLRTFNDAGLNTLGDAATPIITDFKVGKIKIDNQVFKSAFYISSGNYGIKYNKGAGWVEVLVNTSLAANTSNTVNINHETDALEQGDNVLVLAFITNTEGVYESPTFNYTALANDVMMGNGAYGSSACSSVPSLFYLKRSTISIGSTIYTNSACTTPAANGYYSFGGKFYKQITADGNPASVFNVPTVTLIRDCGDWETTDPAYVPPSTKYDYYGYDNFAAPIACSNASSGPLNSLYYPSGTNPTYYTNPQLTNVAPNGWYSDSIGWIRIQAGKKTNQGNC